MLFVVTALTLGCGTPQTPGVSTSVADVQGEVEQTAASSEAPVEGQVVWEGEVDIPGAALGFSATLTPGMGGWTGTIDIPMQGAKGLALKDIAVDEDKVTFTLQPPGAPASAAAVFSGAPDGLSAEGSLKQAGQEFPLTMKRLADDESPAGLSRPQTPQPPFDYEVEEVSYSSGDITIAGTLTRPRGEGPFPAALLITGSGAQDRDETIFEHKPFAVIADRLTRDGVAVLRVDDRGVGGTGGDTTTATAEIMLGDINAGVAWLRAREDIDGGRVGLIGHSEGGMLGPMAAAEDDEIAFVVMLAGTGVPSREILLSQGRTAYEGAGASGGKLEQLMGLHAAALDARGADIEPAVRSLVEAQMAMAGAPMSDEALKAGLAQFNSPWFQSFIALDPKDWLTRVRCPTLALIGSLDFQVPPDTNLPAIRAALADNPDAVVEELEGLNHLFQTAETGLLDEYARIEETFAPAALEQLATWVVAQSQD